MVGTEQRRIVSRWITVAPRRCALLASWLPLVAGCAAPVYTWDTHTIAMPTPQTFDVAEVTRQPVATLGLVAPAGLQGLSAALSHALIAALSEASPSIRGIPAHQTLSALNEQGLAADYGDLLAGFARSGILERERSRRIGAALGSRYVLLPGLAEFNQALVDKFEAAGIKLVRTRITVLRLWLQLWDTGTGRIVWESAGEITAASTLLTARRLVPIDGIAQKLWLRMIQDDLLRGKSQG
jgi:hypothetical protein